MTNVISAKSGCIWLRGTQQRACSSTVDVSGVITATATSASDSMPLKEQRMEQVSLLNSPVSLSKFSLEKGDMA